MANTSPKVAKSESSFVIKRLQEVKERYIGAIGALGHSNYK
jgi:hypothetical protein